MFINAARNCDPRYLKWCSYEIVHSGIYRTMGLNGSGELFKML